MSFRKPQKPAGFSPAQARLKIEVAFRNILDGLESEIRARGGSDRNRRFQLKLTRSQRELMLGVLDVPRTLRGKIECSGDGPRVLALSWRELDALHTLLGEASARAVSPHKRRLEAILKHVGRIMDKETFGDLAACDPVASPQNPTRKNGPRRKTRRIKPEQTVEIGRKLSAIKELLDRFCEAHLTAEWAEVCRRLADALASVDPSPLGGGRADTWAAGIARTVGWVNFLHDKTRQPSMRLAEIDAHFGVSTASGTAKSAAIRECLGIVPLDPAWSLREHVESNPMVWLLEIDGMVIDIRDAPIEMQEHAFDSGLIPYIPGRRPADTDDALRAALIESIGAQPRTGSTPARHRRRVKPAGTRRNDTRDALSEAVAADKLSAKVLKVSGGLIEAGVTHEDRQSRLFAVCSAWNMACGRPERTATILEQWASQFAERNPTTSAEDVAAERRFMASLMERKRSLFPDDTRQIIDAKVIPVGEDFEIEVVFARDR